MCDYFCNFIRSGDPNGQDRNGESLPAWAPWSDQAPCTMVFTGQGAVPDPAPLSPFCQFISDRIVDRIKSIET
jgi:para-nitrobenzyl esterase